jgi:hypothetical protein
MEKIKKLWLQYKNSIKWEVTLFWYIIFNLGVLISEPKFYKFIAIFIFFIYLTLYVWFKKHYMDKYE